MELIDRLTLVIGRIIVFGPLVLGLLAFFLVADRRILSAAVLAWWAASTFGVTVLAFAYGHGGAPAYIDWLAFSYYIVNLVIIVVLVRMLISKPPGKDPRARDGKR